MSRERQIIHNRFLLLSKIPRRQLIEIAEKHKKSISPLQSDDGLRSTLCELVSTKEIDQIVHPEKYLPKEKPKQKANKAKIVNTVNGETQFERYNRLVTRCLKDFNPKPQRNGVMNEWVVRNELTTMIEQNIPKNKVIMERRCKCGRIDIEVSKRIAIELKIIRNETQLWNLIGQLKKYSKEYKQVYLWFYDLSGKVDPSRLRTFVRDCGNQSSRIFVVKKPN